MRPPSALPRTAKVSNNFMMLLLCHLYLITQMDNHEPRYIDTMELKYSLQGDENLCMVLENPFDFKDVQRIISTLYSKISVLFVCFPT